MTRRFLGALVATLFLAHLHATRAVNFLPLSVDALTRQADLVLHGTVLSRTSLRDPNGRIYTKVELQVAEVWKGAVSSSPFPIVHGGGTLGEERSVVDGQVDYQIGEEVVVFLVRNQRGEGVTLGLMQGKFGIWKDPATGLQCVSHPFLEGAPSPHAARQQRHTLDAVPGQLTLARLKEQVEEATR